MKRAPLAIALFLAACQTAMQPTMPAATPAQQPANAVAPDTPQRLAQLPRTVVDYDRSLLNDDEKQVVAKLIEASQAIDEIYWRQVSEDNPAMRADLQKRAASSPLDRAAYDYFVANKGPWDRRARGALLEVGAHGGV